MQTALLLFLRPDHKKTMARYLQSSDHCTREHVSVILAAEVEAVHLLVVSPLHGGMVRKADADADADAD
jgi:hypothetical protein